MKMTRKIKKGDWYLVRAGVLCGWPLLVEIVGMCYDNIDHNVRLIKGKYPYKHLKDEDLILRDVIIHTGYAVKVPKSSNIEMLELLYMPKRGTLDEETQN